MVMEKIQKKNLDGISRGKQKTTEDFYTEVDEKNGNFTTFWIGIIIILIIVFALIISLGLSTKRGLSTTEKITEGESLNLLSFTERMKDVRGGGHTILIFNQAEFATALGTDSDDFPLASAKFEITKDKIRLIGRMKDSLVFWPIGINISHVVIDNKFKFLIAPDSFENIVVSADAKSNIEDTFDRNLNNVLEKNQARAEEIILSDESIELHLIKE